MTINRVRNISILFYILSLFGCSIISIHNGGDNEIPNGIYLIEGSNRDLSNLSSLVQESQKLKIVDCKISSENNENSKFTVDFITNRFPPDSLQKILVCVNDETFKPHSGGGDKEAYWAIELTQISNEVAEQIAKWLSVEPKLRHAPSHHLKLKLIPWEKSYELGHDIDVGVWLSNEGEDNISFQWGIIGERCLNSQLEFSATLGEEKAALNPKRKPPGFRLRSITLKPEAVLKQNLDISDWLVFDRPGKYKITAHYRIFFHGPIPEGQNYPKDRFVKYEELLEAECLIVVK